VLLGVFIGLVGVALLVSNSLKRGADGSVLTLVSAVVVLIAAFSWAAGSVYANRRPIQATTSITSGMQMLAGGSLLFILAAASGDLGHVNFSAFSWKSIGAFFYLLVFGSLVGFTAYSWLLRNVSTAQAATYGYVNPVVAVFLGWLVVGEPVTGRMLLAAAIVICSVVLITTFGRDEISDDSLHDSDCPTHPCA
jgi:drug/metabolite transporter (DMT)-like permease